jgi:hypothetical protein
VAWTSDEWFPFNRRLFRQHPNFSINPEIIQAAWKRDSDYRAVATYRKSAQAGVHSPRDQSAYVRENLQEEAGASAQAGRSTESSATFCGSGS